MRRLKIIHTTAFVLVFGLMGPLTVGQDKPDKQEEKPKSAKPDHQSNPEHQKQDKPAKQQPKGQPEQEKQQSDHAAKQQQQQQQDRSNKQQIAMQQQDQQRKQQQQRQNDDSAQRQEQVRVQQDRQHQVEGDHHNAAEQQRTTDQAQQQQVAWQVDRAQSWQSEHRTWQQRGGYKGYRVPDDRFQNYYGRAHEFRIYTLPVMYVGGHRRFQYGGYWFGLVDPWPEYWSNDWYDRDDVYVDYNDEGYYLYNRRYPRDRISISFYVN
jgi:hypothetical protein